MKLDPNKQERKKHVYKKVKIMGLTNHGKNTVLRRLC